MRKLLAETQEIEQYLLHEMPASARLLFQARMLVAPALREKVRYQRKTLQLIRWLAREEKRRKLDDLLERLMKESSFHHSITSIFK
ncbi:hypothetical protein [Chitinophaga arvensicola]|uniref:Uncharacterized protein n=1 Tax=Chitinophaga arvensicola TaxID=29529 RepID=A0A1I0S6Q4_9BACT|nr:hypothetical protein [Chitinophaga arvensicola]SEW51152.1 hypothetical protein SAMN04488122_4149 [Chitinophaga arvensicola]